MPIPVSPMGPKQDRSIRQSNARLNIWSGSVRSGKTFASIFRWMCFLTADGPPGPKLMIGKTERTLQRNILDPMAAIFGRRFQYSPGKGEGSLFGRKFWTVGANDERAQDKIRGSTLAGAYGDEMTLWPESFYNMLLSRLSVRGAKFFGTTNPDSPHHWVKKNILDRPELNLRHFHFVLADNLALDPDFVSELKKEYVGLWYKRFILGLWVLAEGAIYDMFREDLHVCSSLPDSWDREWVSVDYGTSNPTVFLLQGGRDGNFWTRREYYWASRDEGRQKTDAQYADDMAEFLKGREATPIVVDPSAASFILELEQRGFEVEQANNEVLDGIRTVSSLLGQERYKIHGSCKHTIEEKYAYVWDPKAQKLGEDKPTKEYDHCSDAERYGLVYGATGAQPWTGRVNV